MPKLNEPQLNVAISGRHSVTTRARSSMVMPTPPPLVGWTIASQRSPIPASTSLKSPRSATGFPVAGSRTWTCTIAAPAAFAATARVDDLLRRDGIAALWPGTLIPPVTAQEQKTALMRPPGETTTFSAPSIRSVNVGYAAANSSSENAWVISSSAAPGPRRRARSTSGISPAAARTPAISISSSTTRCSGIARVLVRDPDHRDAAALAQHRHALTERGGVAGALERHLGADARRVARARPPPGRRAVKSTVSWPSSAALASRAPRPDDDRPGRRRARARTPRRAAPSRPGPTTTTVSPGAGRRA